MKVNVMLDDGTIIKRKPIVDQLGNFQLVMVRYNYRIYLIGDGDEYLRGNPEYFTLGSEILS